jgi:hypothetical protein
MRKEPFNSRIKDKVKNASEWYHCSSYGTVLIHIAAHPHSTISEIADALCLTKRSVWGTIGTAPARTAPISGRTGTTSTA